MKSGSLNLAVAQCLNQLRYRVPHSVYVSAELDANTMNLKLELYKLFQYHKIKVQFSSYA